MKTFKILILVMFTAVVITGTTKARQDEQWDCYISNGNFNFCEIGLTSSSISPDGKEVWLAGTGGTTFKWNEIEIPTDYQIYLPILQADASAVSQSRPASENSETLFRLGEWEEIPLPEVVSLGEIEAVSENNVWAGNFGFVNSNEPPTAYHWNGTNWEEKFIDEGVGLRGYSFLDSEFGYAIGYTRSDSWLYKWNGADWVKEENCDLTDMWALDTAILATDDVWITGSQDGGDYGAYFAHWDGDSCELTQIDQSDDQALYKASVVGGSEIWAGGGNGALFYFDGSEWTDQTGEVGTDLIVDLQMQVEDAGYVATRTGLYQYDGTQFTQLDEINTNAISVHNENAILTVTDWKDVNTWNGITWEKFYANDGIPDDILLSSIAMVSSNLGWAVGGKDDRLTGTDGITIMQYDGVNWDEMSVPDHNYYLDGVDALSATDVWAVGFGPTFVHFDGTSWQKETNVDVAEFSHPIDVDMVSSDDVWAVGIGNGPDDGEDFTSVFHWDGVEWSETRISELSRYYKISMLSSTSGYTTGAEGIYQWDGNTWELVFENSFITSIQAVSENNVWATGLSSLFHFDGSSWQVIETPTEVVDEQCQFRAMEMASADSGWISLECIRYDSEAFLYWNGETLEFVSSPVIAYVADFGAANDDDYWAITLYSGRLMNWKAGGTR